METTRQNADPMSAMPLLNMNDGDHLNNEPSWSDQEIEEYSQAPLEGVLRSVMHRPRDITRQQCVLSATFVSTCAFTLGCAFALIVAPLFCELSHYNGFNREKVAKAIVEGVNPNSIRNTLRNISSKPHIAGSDQNFVLANNIREVWTQNGLKDVKLVPYTVLLSYPDEEHPNVVTIKDSSTSNVVFKSSAFQSAILTEERNASSWPAFVAYSPPGKVTADLIYVNYGRPEDFKWLSERGIAVQGKIVIARYGKYFRGSVVKLAEQHGAVGVILYTDPKDYAAEGRNKVYPTAFWLPDTGIQSGTIMEFNGDPSTPGYPSVDGSFRLSEDRMQLPKVPVQPISYKDAEQILALLDGLESPRDWKGGLNASYKIGPKFQRKSLQIGLEVSNVRKMTTIYDVIGIIPGLEEPDRYVLVGNHHDAWIFGGIDPNSGTAVVTELTRVFGQLYKKGWKPRRTIVFCSWDAEEYGLIGSTEWVEEHSKMLTSQAIAYINVDVAVEGNFSLFTRASPSLIDVIFESAKKIPNPNADEVAEGRLTVYDTWLHAFNTTSNKPEVQLLGAGSDFTAFIYNVGVPSLDYSYTADLKVYPAGNPLYHSLYETFYAIDKLLDPDFKYHVAVARICGETIRALADSPLLPLSVTSYGEAVQNAFVQFKQQFNTVLKANDISLDFLDAAIQRFLNATHSFVSSLSSSNLNEPLVLRSINDKLMQVERAFIIPEGLPGSHFKHVLISPSKTDSYSGKYFPALIDNLSNTLSTNSSVTEHGTSFKEHLSQLVYCIQSATLILTGEIEK